MDATVVIDGREVNFRSTGATPLRYKKQFGKDFFSEIAKFQWVADAKAKGEKINLDKMDFEPFYNICWTFAKTADKTIPSPLEWLDEFEVFPLFEILPEIEDLLIANLQTKKN